MVRNRLYTYAQHQQQSNCNSCENYIVYIWFCGMLFSTWYILFDHAYNNRWGVFIQLLLTLATPFSFPRYVISIWVVSHNIEINKLDSGFMLVGSSTRIYCDKFQKLFFLRKTFRMYVDPHIAFLIIVYCAGHI